MTKFVKAIKGNVAAAGRLFSEGTVSPVTDEVATSPEVVQMEKLGYLKVFDDPATATAHTFTGIAAQARSTNTPPVAGVAAQEVAKLTAEDAKRKALAAADAKLVAEAAEAAEVAKNRLTAAQAKANADAVAAGTTTVAPVSTPAVETAPVAPTPAATPAPASTSGTTSAS